MNDKLQKLQKQMEALNSDYRSLRNEFYDLKNNFTCFVEAQQDVVEFIITNMISLFNHLEITPLKKKSCISPGCVLGEITLENVIDKNKSYTYECKDCIGKGFTWEKYTDEQK